MPDFEGTDRSEAAGAAMPDATWCERLIRDDPLGRMLIARDGTIAHLNPAAASMAGLSPAEAVGRNVLDFVAEDDVALALEALHEMEEYDPRSEGVPMVFGLRRADGTTMYVELGAKGYLDEPELGLISLRVRAYDSWAHLEEYLRQLVGAAPVARSLATLARSIDHGIQQCASAFALGWDGRRVHEWATASVPDGLLPAARDPEGDEDEHDGDDPDVPWLAALRTGETALELDLTRLPADLAEAARRAGFASCWAEPVFMPEEPQPVAAVVVWRRLDTPPRVGHREALRRFRAAAALAFERQRTEERLVRAATTDPLTGIPNRATFFRLLERALVERGGTDVAVVYLDLDGFKPLNDAHGHRFGDLVLAEVAYRLTRVVRADDLVARVGGDEFTVLCRSAGDLHQTARLAERLIGAVDEPLEVGGRVVHLTASAGVARAPEHGTDHDALVEAADQALYAAKRAGGSRWHAAEP
ncbi:MAG: GGDEF domain-containing protein [Actinobacteria bacterium]|nr:GGDEF domain-containing protein [Actinomycetota bacterium]